MEEFDWKNIDGFHYRFVGERKSFADQRNRLNNKYGYFCPAPDDMFITGDDGSRQLIADPIVFLRKQLAQDIMLDLNIIDNAKRTEAEDHIAVLLAGVTFNGITNNGARFRLRNSQGMNDIGKKTHAEGHQDFILEIDIDHWIFRRTWNSKRFDKIYLEGHETPSDSESDDDDSSKTEPTAKRNKTLATLVSSNDFDAVVEELLRTAAPFRGNTIVDPKTYRVPHHEIRGTWNEDVLKEQLISMRKDARLRLKSYKDEDGSRDPIVIAIRNGSGFGKTHVLTEAPRLLSAKGIYVTYNKNQNLRVDSEKTEQAIILRLILVLAGYAPRECSAVLTSEEAVPFLGIPEQWLQALFLAYVDKLMIGEIAVCVDETRKLPDEAARRAMSALTSLAARYLETKDVMCTIIVSTLNADTFKTISERTLIPWPIARPDHTTLNFFAYLFPKKDKEKTKALVNALSGAHMRSIVYCFQLGQEDMNASIEFLMNRMDQSHGANTTDNDLVEVRAHIEACITSRYVPKVSDVIEGLSDNRKAVPPCYILRSYAENNAALSILKALFGSFSLYNSPGKQLEEVGKQYDLFRATMELCVVPGRAEVHIPPGVTAERKWFKELKFPSSLVVDKSAILEQQNVAGSTKKRIVATEVRPKTGCYYHPKVENHPWIDRLYVAYHFGDKKECIVLIQDKVNSADYSKACKKLELAANVLSKAHGFDHVLLIVNVIGASDQTIAQKKLTWPHILVRGMDGVRNYYSESFADMVYFARHRHQLSLDRCVSPGPPE